MDMKMIRPCVCKGTLSHVHLLCLNSWRATSVNAYYECSVCKYKYQLKREPIADFLMSENGALITTVMIILSVVLTVGSIVYAISMTYFQVSIAQKLYSILDINMSVNYWYSRKLNTTSTIAVQNYLLSIMRMLIRYHIIDVLSIGIAAVGACGFLQYMVVELLKERDRGDGNQLPFQKIATFILWMSSLGHKSLSRFSCSLGCAIAFREVYAIVIVHGRTLALKLGEKIIEYSAPTQPQ